jgi:DMSO/TMAO reductase YedYZ molybdopterin-dependent catalytic subunit
MDRWRIRLKGGRITGIKRRDFLRLSVLFLAGCAVPPKTAPAETPTSTALAVQATPVPPDLATCRLTAVVAPTPAARPGPDQLDDVGLHVTASAVHIDLSTYRLRVTGLVDHPLELSLDDLRCMPKMTARPNLTCQGVFEDVTSWSGVPIRHVLELAGVQTKAKAINMVGADQFQAYSSLNDALQMYNYLAYQWQDQPLPVLHGFPVRAVMATTFGYAWVKWLVQIQVT